MRLTFSLRTIVLGMLLVGLILSIVVCRLEVSHLKKQCEQLRNQIRSQVNSEEYSVSGCVLAQTSEYLVYSIDTEATFFHALVIHDDNQLVSTNIILNGDSYVSPESNIWTCHWILVVTLQGERLRYSVSTKPRISDGHSIEVWAGSGEIPSLQGFGQSGTYFERVSIPIAKEMNRSSLPFQIELVRR